MMEDDETQVMFTEDMRRLNIDTTVRGVPSGDPVFIFCVFKGKKSNIMTFIDSGANVWLAEDGIPQNELISVKHREGPIPLGVASGITAHAEAEWSSLLPLEDGTYQVVRGLTMKNITSDMPEVDLNPALNTFKREYPRDKRVQNLKVPKVVGGRINMILGIAYQAIYPTPLHTLQNGLTLFESKLRATSPGMLACIGGPIDCLNHICGNNGAESTFSYMTHLITNSQYQYL